MNMWSVKKTFRNCPMIGCYFDHCTCMHMCMHAHISVEQVQITNALLFSLNRTSPVVEVLKCERLANSSGSSRCPPMRWVKCVALYNRSAFTVNFDVINYHVTLLYGNVHMGWAHADGWNHVPPYAYSGELFCSPEDSIQRFVSLHV